VKQCFPGGLAEKDAITHRALTHKERRNHTEEPTGHQNKLRSTLSQGACKLATSISPQIILCAYASSECGSMKMSYQ